DEWNASRAAWHRLDLRKSESWRSSRSEIRQRAQARVSPTRRDARTIRDIGVRSLLSSTNGWAECGGEYSARSRLLHGASALEVESSDSQTTRNPIVLPAEQSDLKMRTEKGRSQIPVRTLISSGEQHEHPLLTP